MIGVLVAVVVVAGVAAAVALAKYGKHPEQTASHTITDPVTESERLYAHDDRPAGPDAEDAPLPGTRARARREGLDPRG